MALLSRHYRAWTAAENRQLRELARKEMFPRLLVMHLGRTVDPGSGCQGRNLAQAGDTAIPTSEEPNDGHLGFVSVPCPF